MLLMSERRDEVASGSWTRRFHSVHLVVGRRRAGSLTNGDPCKSATPKPGCLKIVTPPRLLSPIRPDCSAGVCKKKHGVVVLRAVISESGQLKEISFVSGDGKLREVALNTVRQWHALQ
jgi:hypothetical protein